MAAVPQPLTGSAAGEAVCPVVGAVMLKDVESGAVRPVLGTELRLWFSGGVLISLEWCYFCFSDWVL